jgi:hypothetical protein
MTVSKIAPALGMSAVAAYRWLKAGRPPSHDSRLKLRAKPGGAKRQAIQHTLELYRAEATKTGRPIDEPLFDDLLAHLPPHR